MVTTVEKAGENGKDTKETETEAWKTTFTNNLCWVSSIGASFNLYSVIVWTLLINWVYCFKYQNCTICYKLGSVVDYVLHNIIVI